MRTSFLVGDKIYLRALEETDLNADYREWFNDEEVCRYNSHHRFPNYDENMRDYYEKVIKSRTNLVLAVCDKQSDKHIGNIALENIDPQDRSAEFAIILGDKAYWGTGAGKEASRLIVKHGFEQLNLNRIYCGTSAENKPMQKLAIALGMQEEGKRREAMFKNGNFTDIIEYGLLRRDFSIV